MCLEVKKTSNKLILKCKKALNRDWENRRKFFTPYQGTEVPYNGWLIPDYKGQIHKHEKIIYSYSFGVPSYIKTHKDVEGGFIHAYLKNNSNYSNYYDAYAIQVVAYGRKSDEDIICRALYIPHADKNAKRRKAIVEFLESKPTKRQIIEKFPFLKEKL